MEWMSQVEFWHWLLIAVILVSLEMLILPAAYFLWMGISAGLVGSLMLVFPGMTFLVQAIIFALFAVISLIIHKCYLRANPPVSDEPALNRRGEQYVGRMFTLEEPIVNGVGKVKVGDSTWKVSGPDLEAGVRVKVSGVDGATFLVEAAT